MNNDPEFDCTADIEDYEGDFDYADADDGQPTMYEEYQDLYGGDDNFLDWAVDDF